MGRIKTYEDARDYLGYLFNSEIHYTESVKALAKLQTNSGCAERKAQVQSADWNCMVSLGSLL